VPVPTPTRRKRLLCRLNIHHKWVRQFNPDGEIYLQCKACGKDRYDVEGRRRTDLSLYLLASKKNRDDIRGPG
jgi:hypothetical protein